jgi:membrane-bound lytic murein transglycosylase B
MPYNLKYVIDGDNNGTRDLFSWPDAIMSAANYLKNVGGYSPSEANRKKAIKRYNASDSYVSGVMLYADTIWERYLNGH